jgi:hypothetical protein
MSKLLRLSLLRCERHELSPADAQTAALPEVTGSEHVRYELSHGDLVCIAVHNDSEHDLYVTLIDAATSGRVRVLGTGQIPARSRERFWLDNNLGHAFHVTLPDGQDLGVDRLVAIGTTVAGMDLGHLRQDLSFAQYRTFRDRDLRPVESKTPVEQYTSATADVWVRPGSAVRKTPSRGVDERMPYPQG